MNGPRSSKEMRRIARIQSRALPELRKLTANVEDRIAVIAALEIVLEASEGHGVVYTMLDGLTANLRPAGVSIGIAKSD